MLTLNDADTYWSGFWLGTPHDAEIPAGPGRFCKIGMVAVQSPFTDTGTRRESLVTASLTRKYVKET